MAVSQSRGHWLFASARNSSASNNRTFIGEVLGAFYSDLKIAISGFELAIVLAYEHLFSCNRHCRFIAMRLDVVFVYSATD